MAKVYRKGKEPIGKNVLVIVSGVALLFFSVFLILLIPNHGANAKKILTPLTDVINIYTTPIGRLAQKDLLGRGGVYAVYVKNLKTGETYSLNKDEVFESASLYKLWVMAVTMDQINKHKISEDESLSAKKINLDRTLELLPNTDDSGTNPSPAPEDTSVISYKIKDALHQMITVSDNYAALLLVNKVGAKNIDKFLADNNFSDSNFGSPPMTTPANIEEYFEKLYSRQFVSASISGQMINLLKKQEINDRIPKYLPSKVQAAHKTGELDGNKHDAGIVFSKSGDYIIVLMSDTLDETLAAENEANFSRDVFNYFDTKSTQ